MRLRIGAIFGRLTVLEIAGKAPNGAYLYLCRCECGVEKPIMGNTLTGGRTKSCGCLRRETSSRLGKVQAALWAERK